MEVNLQNAQMAQATQQTQATPPVRNVERSAPQPAASAPAPIPTISTERISNVPQGLEEFPTTAPVMREEDINDQMLERAFTEANRALDGGSFRLSYGMHEASNRIHVAVYDSNTDELIREFPSESRLDLYARITEFTGLLFDSSS